MWARCEDCGQWVPAEITHNGVMRVGHYVHCGWGHTCHPEDLRPEVPADKNLVPETGSAVDAG